jgi:Inward rectifier potassium channel transmembrane domain
MLQRGQLGTKNIWNYIVNGSVLSSLNLAGAWTHTFMLNSAVMRILREWFNCIFNTVLTLWKTKVITIAQQPGTPMLKKTVTENIGAQPCLRIEFKVACDCVVNRRLDTMCTFEVYDFASALLYSVEAQTTLGYGSRVSNPHCSQSLALLIIQLVIGLAIDGVIAGLLIDKLTRQRRRGRSVEFGRRAVIFRSSQDGSYLLGIRIFYRGKSPLLSASVKAVFVSCNGKIKDSWLRDSLE